jgi:hypothetical protein
MSAYPLLKWSFAASIAASSGLALDEAVADADVDPAGDGDWARVVRGRAKVPTTTIDATTTHPAPRPDPRISVLPFARARDAP